MTYVTGLVNFRMYYPTWLNNVLRQSGGIRDYLRKSAMNKLLVLNLICCIHTFNLNCVWFVVN